MKLYGGNGISSVIVYVVCWQVTISKISLCFYAEIGPAIPLLFTETKWLINSIDIESGNRVLIKEAYFRTIRNILLIVSVCSSSFILNERTDMLNTN